VTDVAALVAEAAARLTAAGVDSPDVDARELARHCFGVDPRRAPSAVPDEPARRAFTVAVARRAAREPLQLIVGSAAFHDLELVCRPGVFVPRPETEVLAALALAALAARARERPGEVLRVAEPCTGTGAVALTLASARSDVVVVATDVSPAAVALATENRDRIAAAGRLRGRVDVRLGHLLDPLGSDGVGALDLLVANPPYLPAADAPTWAPEVADHDPRAALVGGDDGHEVVDALIDMATSALAPGGTVLVELDALRTDDAAARARRAGLADVRIHDDLTGRPRVLAARRVGTPR
jgi:release factor glutamine methyltransferase